MFAIICSGDKQFKVSSGDFVRVPYLPEEKPRTTLKLKPLALEDDSHFFIGSEELKKASVTAKVLRHGLGKKTIVFKKKRRKGYRKTRGHRQNFTELQIIEIKLPSGKVLSQEKLKKSSPKKKSSVDVEASKTKNVKQEKKALEKSREQKTMSDGSIKKRPEIKKTQKPVSTKTKSMDKKKNKEKKPGKASLKTKKTTGESASQTETQKTVKSKSSTQKSSEKKT